jgi:hypothetical protein
VDREWIAAQPSLLLNILVTHIGRGYGREALEEWFEGMIEAWRRYEGRIYRDVLARRLILLTNPTTKTFILLSVYPLSEPEVSKPP